MRQLKRSLIAAAAAAISLAVAPAVKAQDVITIGATSPITGGLSSLYSVQGKLWEAWQQAQNEAGGVFVKSLNKKLPIKIVYYDDQSDPKASVRFYERLVNVDNVNFLLAPQGSPIAFAASTVAERYKMPMIAGAVNDPAIFSRGFKYIQGVLAPAVEYSSMYFDMVHRQTKVNKVALLVEDTLFSRGVSTSVRAAVKKYGMDLVYDQTAPVDTQDFTAIITQIKETNPDLVYVSTFPPFYIRFAKQADELGLKPAAIHCPLCSSVSVRNGLGPLANDVTGEIYWAPGMKLGDYKMLERTLEISGLDPLQWSFALISIPSLEVLRHGIEAAGSLDREAVYKAIQEDEIPTVMGKFKAVGNGIATINPFPMQNQNGKVAVIWPPESKTGDYHFPRTH
jgi:branched-chain amino acid transport system substrate-binding protein